LKLGGPSNDVPWEMRGKNNGVERKEKELKKSIERQRHWGEKYEM